MGEDIIGMQDIMAVFDVTDRYGIEREKVSVPLEKSGAGGVSKQAGGALEIVVPASMPADEWTARLQAALEALGFEPQEEKW